MPNKSLLDYCFDNNKPAIINYLTELLCTLLMYEDTDKHRDIKNICETSIPDDIPWNTLRAFTKQMTLKHDLYCTFEGSRQTINMQKTIAQRIILTYSKIFPNLFETFDVATIYSTQPHAVRAAELTACLLLKNTSTLPTWSNFLDCRGKGSRNKQRNAIIDYIPRLYKTLPEKITNPETYDDKELVYNLLASVYILHNIILSLSVCDIFCCTIDNCTYTKLRGFNSNGDHYVPTIFYLPEGVQLIIDKAFWHRFDDANHNHWHNIKSVVFPSSLKWIGYNAFRGFNYLEELDFRRLTVSEQLPLHVHAGAFSGNSTRAPQTTVTFFKSIETLPNFTVIFHYNSQAKHDPFWRTNVQLPLNMYDTPLHSLPLR